MSLLQFNNYLQASQVFNLSLNSDKTVDPFPVRPWQLSCYVVITILGVIGNVMVVLVIKGNAAMRKSSFGTYLGGLAIADVLVALSCIPVYITSTSAFEKHPTGIAGDVFCKLISGYNILFFFATVSVYTMVVISIERYIAICHPFFGRTHLSPKRAKMIIAVIWIFSALLGLLSIVGEKYAPMHNATIGAHCTFANAYTNDIAPKVVYVFVFSVQFLFPVCMMAFCFVKIRKTLLTQSLSSISSMAGGQKGAFSQIQARKKSVRTILVVIISYFSCWSMNQVVYFCYNFALIHASWNSNVIQLSVVLCFFSSCINPFIYGFLSRQFRNGFTYVFYSCVLCGHRSAYQSFN